MPPVTRSQTLALKAFGPLSAEHAELIGLSKEHALSVVRRKIHQRIAYHAPECPQITVVNNPLKFEGVPWLNIGTIRDRKNAGRWYLMNLPTDMALADYFYYITDPLDVDVLEGDSMLQHLYSLYDEIVDSDYQGPRNAKQGSARTRIRRKRTVNRVNETHRQMKSEAEAEAAAQVHRTEPVPFPPLSPLAEQWEFSFLG
ncbi:hypothetical protein CPC08DRAFT_770106 [Agrocybe pediades]|nr:hypothetical protein CPC08DRAFT_770106 [Agrocybe pediades]